MRQNMRVLAIGLATFLLLAVVFVGWPLYDSYDDHYGAGKGIIGWEEGNPVGITYVGRIWFEGYKAAVWIDEALNIQFREFDIHCNGERIRFPRGMNVALVSSPDDITFVALADGYFEEFSGRSEGGYFFWKMPTFKDKRKGSIDLAKVKEDGVIAREWESFIHGASTQEGVISPPEPDPARR